METIARILEEFNACTHLVVRAFDRFENCVAIEAGHTNRLCCCLSWRKTVFQTCEMLHSTGQEWVTLPCSMPACEYGDKAGGSLFFTACFADPAMHELGIYVFGPYSHQPADTAFPYKPAEVEPYLVKLLQMIAQKHLCNQTAVPQITTYSYQVQRCLEFVRTRLSEAITLRDAADYLEITPSYLCRLFKKETGVPFSEYINQLRIERSCTLLCDTSYSILEVAMAVGFSSQSYYSRMFKKICGITPQQYKQRRSLEGEKHPDVLSA